MCIVDRVSMEGLIQLVRCFFSEKNSLKPKD